MRCAICGKTVPITAPPYMRIYKDEKTGKWIPSKNMCQCNKEEYDFMVLGLIKRMEKKDKE